MYFKQRILNGVHLACSLSKIISYWKTFKLSKSSCKMESTIWDMCLHLRLYFTFLLRREATKLRIISTSKLRDCAGMLVTHVFSSHCEGWLSKLLFVFGLDCWATMVLCLCACVCVFMYSWSISNGSSRGRDARDT